MNKAKCRFIDPGSNHDWVGAFGKDYAQYNFNVFLDVDGYEMNYISEGASENVAPLNDYTSYTPEQIFQESLLWQYPMDFGLVQKIQVILRELYENRLYKAVQVIEVQYE